MILLFLPVCRAGTCQQERSDDHSRNAFHVILQSPRRAPSHNDARRAALPPFGASGA
jgi:hypothetical protein